jgi:putative toxin-antitoxin system antitoxin component (TIGR02293 family)
MNLLQTLIKGKVLKSNLDSDRDIVTLARKGLDTKAFYVFSSTIKMPEKELAGLLNISARTISNYKISEKPLDANYSEHLLKLIKLYKKGEAIFGNIDEFNYWLRKPFWNARQSPMDWLSTPGGVDLVVKEIENIAEGYPI